MIKPPLGIYTLENIRDYSRMDNPVILRKVIGGKKWRTHELMQDVTLKLSNDRIITIPKGFTWDLSSVPRIFWAILPPDGNFIISALIHDWLYQNSIFVINWFLEDSKAARKFADREMLAWATAMQGTTKISLRNIDNHARYYGVRIGGGFVWDKD